MDGNEGSLCVADDAMFVLLYIDYIQLTTSLLNIFYTTATFPRQVRLMKPEENQIKIFSMATVALIVWRSLIVGSRILAFVLFALLFHYWLFVVTGFHYLLMFALVFYQMRLSNKMLIKCIVYIVVTPFIYMFDFCVNLLSGPTLYWYILVYVSIYCENLLMSALGLWYASTVPRAAWYIVPCFVSVIVMFPLGLIAQVIYYRYYHPVQTTQTQSLTVPETTESTPTTRLQFRTWSVFRAKVVEANTKTNTSTNNMPFIIPESLVPIIERRLHNI